MENDKRDQIIGYMLSQVLEDVERIKETLYGENEESSYGFKIAILKSIVTHNKNHLIELKHRIDCLENRIVILEREDRKSRVKITIFLIVLIFTYLTASIPKILSVLELLYKLI